MKKITLLSLSIALALFLSACVSESNGTSTTSQTISPSRSNPETTNTTEITTSSHTPPLTSAPPIQSTNPTSVYTPPPTSTVRSSNWQRVYMHYDILKGQPMEWGESGGYLSLFLAENAYQGAYSIKLDSSHGLLTKQLITYKGSDNQHYTTTVQSIDGNTINLSTPLEKNVWYGKNAWNFYDNASHPNYRGYLAIADHAVRTIGRGNLNYGKHVLFGDSWFSSGTVYDRLKESLSNATFINLGNGGNTSNDLLARFDTDVPEYSPTFVWLLSGTNDYWNYISVEQYKRNIQRIIKKIESLGAKPVIVDPSVGPLNYGSHVLTTLSHSYTNAIEQLQYEN